MNARTPSNSLKRPVNLSIDADLLEKARSLGINLSQTLEVQLAQLVRKAEAAAWLKQNRTAVDAYNERIARDGLWSDGLRSF